ncbi:MAG: hypothetical protein IJX92_07165 [Clostridia bacterium]|nr:hypothetical protein [Clostridia bacterium]
MLLYLLSLASEEEKENVTWLYCEYVEDMLVYARTKLRDMGDQNFYHDGYDAVHSAYERIIKYKKLDFSKSPKEIKNYLRATVANQVKNMLEDINKIQSFDEDCGIAGVTEEEFFDRLCLMERCALVEKAADFLDEKYVSVLMLYAKHTPAEVSKIIGLPVKTVYTRINRARKLLMERVETMERGGVING